VLLVIALVMAAAGAIFYFHPGIFVMEAQRFRAWRMGLEDKTVLLGGQRIHYLAGGRGKPLVLVHGLAGRGEDWFALIPKLMHSGYRVYAPDLLGYGRSARPDVDYSIALEEDVVGRFMDSQNIQQADLAGWSMGGWIAIKFAAEHPQRVRSLILLDSAGLKFDAVNAPLLRPRTEADLQHMMQVLTPHPPYIPSFYARDLLRDFAQEDWIIDRALKSMYAGKDLMDGKLAGLKLPVLLVWGKQDVLTPPSIAEQMHQAMPQSQLQILDGCGHLAPVECSDQVGKDMINFLSTARQQGRSEPTPGVQ
jgi:pimeloyl-ACP methyl ester carboxylesterase